MANLKDLKTRINSVKSTQKITAAMKMVAAAKLRRAQDAAESGRPYSTRMRQVIGNLASKADPSSAPQLLVGTGKDQTHLLVIMSADRGLCGGFIDQHEGLQGTSVNYDDAAGIADTIRSKFEAGEVDVCTLIFNKFKNAITQEITLTRLIPAEVDGSDAADNDAAAVSYEYEPEEDELLASLLPRNLSTQIYSALLESSAAELAARMTAMDNATRNAGELIDRLTLVYNRTRQANITSELIEIISGAEAI